MTSVYDEKIYPQIPATAPPDDAEYRLKKIDEIEKFLRSEVEAARQTHQTVQASSYRCNLQRRKRYCCDHCSRRNFHRPRLYRYRYSASPHSYLQ